jgi:hypothetical protein
MSDDFLIFVPTAPHLVPTLEVQKQTTELVRSSLPDADEVSAEANERVQFYDCGSNFSRVSCPHCQAELSLDWWGEIMDEDYDDGGFHLARYELPCCQRSSNLNELHYDWPQAFGRFAISAMNPNIGPAPDSLRAAVAEKLGCTVVTIHQHI